MDNIREVLHLAARSKIEKYVHIGYIPVKSFILKADAGSCCPGGVKRSTAPSSSSISLAAAYLSLNFPSYST